MLLSDRFFRYLHTEKRYSAHTVEAYVRDHAQFALYCQEQYEVADATLVSHVMIRSWVVSLMERGLEPRSIQRKISTVRTFFKLLLRDGIVTSNPTQKVVTPKRSSRVPEFVAEVDMERLLDPAVFSPDFAGTRDYLILTLLYETGMRRAELIGLDEGDVIKARMEVRVFGKRAKERRIPISPDLLKLIEAYLTYKQESFPDQMPSALIVTDRGKKVYPKFVYTTVKRYLLAVTTVGQKSPHVIRHTFATHMLNHGADLNAIKEMLGHASLAATQVYTHNSIEKLKDIHKQAHPRG